MDEKDNAPAAVEATEFVLADELKKVWINNPLKTVALEIMGKTILSCLEILKPDMTAKMIAYDESAKYVLDSVALETELPTGQLFLSELWCTENESVSRLIGEIAKQLDYGVVKGSVSLMPFISTGENDIDEPVESFTLFTLTFMRRAR